MGVLGLASLLKESFTSFGKRVVFNDLSQDGSTKTIIVVDGSAFVYFICQKALGPIAVAVANYSKLYLAVIQWYEQYAAVGIRFIFVFDGATDRCKLPTKLKRTMNHCRAVHDHAMEATKLGWIRFPSSTQENKETIRNVLPLLAIATVLQALKQVNADTIFAEGEADPEIVIQAARHRAIAILSNDSDMVITCVNNEYFGFLPFWSFGFDSESGIAYGHIFHANSICKLSGISIDAIQLLGPLVGNDFSEDDISLELQKSVEKLIKSPTVRTTVKSTHSKSSTKSKAKKKKKKKTKSIPASSTVAICSATGVENDIAAQGEIHDTIWIQMCRLCASQTVADVVLEYSWCVANPTGYPSILTLPDENVASVTFSEPDITSILHDASHRQTRTTQKKSTSAVQRVKDCLELLKQVESISPRDSGLLCSPPSVQVEEEDELAEAGGASTLISTSSEYPSALVCSETFRARSRQSLLAVQVVLILTSMDVDHLVDTLKTLDCSNGQGLASLELNAAEVFAIRVLAKFRQSLRQYYLEDSKQTHTDLLPTKRVGSEEPNISMPPKLVSNAISFEWDMIIHRRILLARPSYYAAMRVTSPGRVQELLEYFPVVDRQLLSYLSDFQHTRKQSLFECPYLALSGDLFESLRWLRQILYYIYFEQSNQACCGANQILGTRNVTEVSRSIENGDLVCTEVAVSKSLIPKFVLLGMDTNFITPAFDTMLLPLTLSGCAVCSDLQEGAPGSSEVDTRTASKLAGIVILVFRLTGFDESFTSLCIAHTLLVMFATSIKCSVRKDETGYHSVINTVMFANFWSALEVSIQHVELFSELKSIIGVGCYEPNIMANVDPLKFLMIYSLIENHLLANIRTSDIGSISLDKLTLSTESTNSSFRRETSAHLGDIVNLDQHISWGSILESFPRGTGFATVYQQLDVLSDAVLLVNEAFQLILNFIRGGRDSCS